MNSTPKTATADDSSSSKAPDPQALAAVIRASGHSQSDAALILAELNRIGWDVRQRG